MQLDLLCRKFEQVLRYELNYSEATIKRYAYNVTQLGKFLALHFFNGEVPQAADVRPAHVRRFLSYLSRERGCKASTIASTAWDLSAFFSHAVRAGFIKDNPVRKVTASAGPTAAQVSEHSGAGSAV